MLMSPEVLFSLLCFKQKTAYEMRISDWSSDVCSSDLLGASATDSLADGGPFVAAQIVHDDNVTRRERRYEELLDIVGEALAVEIGRASCRERVCQYV